MAFLEQYAVPLIGSLLGCGCFGLTLYWLRQVILIQNQLIDHIKSEHSDAWLHFCHLGLSCGNQQKWARHFALEAIREGKFAHGGDSVLTHGNADIKRYHQRISLCGVFFFALVVLL